jgi:hypothetical protein
VKAVRIGNSPIAPLFEVVAKPNGWDRQIQQQLRTSGELSELSRWRKRFWECLLERHPEQAAWGDSDATSSRWRPVPGTDPVVAIYLAQKQVGLFIRGPRRGAPEDVLDQLAPHQQALEARLGARMGGGGCCGHFFSRQHRGELRDESCWPAMADWLQEQQGRTVEVIGEELGDEGLA